MQWARDYLHGRGPIVIRPIPGTMPPPNPMPDVRDALVDAQDARAALSRYIWNRSQLEDALDSAERFIAKARARLAK